MHRQMVAEFIRPFLGASVLSLSMNYFTISWNSRDTTLFLTAIATWPPRSAFAQFLFFDQVFLNEECRPPHEDSLSRVWRKAVIAVSITPRPTVHDLRHCWKTNAIRSWNRGQMEQGTGQTEQEQEGENRNRQNRTGVKNMSNMSNMGQVSF